MPNFKALVDTDWTFPGNSHDEIRTAALLDIARNVRAMASNYQSLINDRDSYKRWYERERATSERLERSVRSLRGAITKLKKRGAI